MLADGVLSDVVAEDIYGKTQQNIFATLITNEHELFFVRIQLQLVFVHLESWTETSKFCRLCIGIVNLCIFVGNYEYSTDMDIKYLFLYFISTNPKDAICRI